MAQIFITIGTLALIGISGLLILLILLQRGSTSGGLGTAFGSGITESALGADTTNVLSKGTIFSIGGFFALGFVLYLGNMAKAVSEGNGPDANFQHVVDEAKSEADIEADKALTEAMEVEAADTLEGVKPSIETTQEGLNEAVDSAESTLKAAAATTEEVVNEAKDAAQPAAE